MSIYIPRHFLGDAAGARRLIEAHPFATLITAEGEAPRVTHLPLLLEDEHTLIGHMARVNPHWRSFPVGETVAIFHGPHAFVSRHWYPAPADNVPTWNYATVHVHGKPELCDARLAVERLATRFEPSQHPPIAEAKMARLVEGIVGFRIPLASLDVKFKMSQNKSPAEIAGVVAGLRATGDHAAAATAEFMRSLALPAGGDAGSPGPG